MEPTVADQQEERGALKMALEASRLSNEETNRRLARLFEAIKRAAKNTPTQMGNRYK